MTANAEKKTAAQTYNERAAEISALMGWITDELEVHAERAAADPANWGHAGDLGEIKSKMRDALSFLSGTTEQEINEALDDLRA